MDISSNGPPGSRRPVVVEAPTLKDALRQVRLRYGEEARVIRSRTLVRRQRGGLGTEKVVEVLVEPTADGRQNHRPEPAATTPSAGGRTPAPLAAELTAEVARIEELVRQISHEHDRLTAARIPATIAANPLAGTLVRAGAATDVVGRLFARFRAETGASPDDREAALEYLASVLPTGSGRWEDVAGCHVLLGPAGSGKTELALATAARLVSLGRQVLVLEVLPRHGGEIRRLQAEAARHGYDAAILQKPEQLASSAVHIAGYDAVLIDTPGWEGAALAESPALRQHIVSDPAYHRHLVLPLDLDLDDARETMTAARAWNCDWTTTTRLDRTCRHGKLLNLLDRLPLPLSWQLRGPWPGGEVHLAGRDRLVASILNAAEAAESSVDHWSAAG